MSDTFSLYSSPQHTGGIAVAAPVTSHDPVLLSGTGGSLSQSIDAHSGVAPHPDVWGQKPGLGITGALDTLYQNQIQKTASQFNLVSTSAQTPQNPHFAPQSALIAVSGGSRDAAVQNQSGPSSTTGIFSSQDLSSTVLSASTTAVSKPGDKVVTPIDVSSSSRSSDPNQRTATTTLSKTRMMVSQTALQTMNVDSSNFSWPNFQIPSIQAFASTSQASFIHDDLTYSFQRILQRDPSSAEISQFTPDITSHYLGTNVYVVKVFDDTYARKDIAHLQETTNKLQASFQSVLGVSASSDVINAGETYLGENVEFQSLESAIVSYNNINLIYESILGRSITSGDVSYVAGLENNIENGQSLQDQRVAIAHSGEARDDVSSIYQQVLGRTPTDSDAVYVQGFQNNMANGQSLQDQRVSIAQSADARSQIDKIYQQVLGRTPTDSDAVYVQGFQNNMANGQSLQDQRVSIAYSGEDKESLSSDIQFIFGRASGDSEISGYEAQLSDNWSRSQILLSLVSSSEFQNITRNVYADWGQLAPTDAELKTAGQAMFNLHAAWIIAKDQTTDQLQAEANGYQALSANSSFQDYIDNVAGSADQARDLEASMLADPLMEQTDNVQDVRTLLSQGGGPVEGAMVDQGVMKTVIQQDKENPMTPCDDVSAFREAHTKVVYNTPQITSANAQWQTVNQRDWPATYVTNGVVWNEDRGGAGASAQGLPYEAYVQEKLNGGNPTGDYVWLQDHRSNWMTFDHWNEDTRDAVSDKALNTNRDMYTRDPANIKYRIWADMKEMAMKYTVNESRQGTTTPVSFSQDVIETYTFELGVRTATTTDAQWKQICEAYRGAGAKMTSYERNGYKPLDFEIDAIS
ncbi:hypothetical protein JK222_14235 [Gluconobacter cerinus]|uniref:endonuclease toxin domain-containing protein n=1 Tax=Gluconobacter cerinus TaxID=38307 RepID=UPI001B8C8180|nr:hypothetical protein [Gluconobacter cerinus]MBS1072843.1 hypothetical protein [Gluconobacter cerinus]